MLYFDDVVKENIKEYNSNWIPIYHPYGILIIGCSGSDKMNLLFNLINQQLHIDKIYLYPKVSEAKYQFLINERESVGLKYFNDSKPFNEYSIDMDDIYKKIEKYNPNEKRKI